MSDLDAAALPKYEFDRPETSDLGVAPAQFEADTITNNYWWLSQRRSRATEDDYLGQMSETLYGNPTAYLGETPTTLQDPASAALSRFDAKNAAIKKMFADAERARTNMPGEFANLPTSYEELALRAVATTTRQLEEEKADAEAALANRSDPNWLGGAASFAGSMAAGVSDVEGVMTLPFGAGAGSLGRTILIESLLGGAGAALQIPGQQHQAERLGFEAPDPVAQVLSGMAFGAVLPIGGRVLHLGVNAVTPAGRIANRDLLTLGRRAGATDIERGATAALGRDEATRDIGPAGVPPEAHGARVDAAADALENDAPLMVNPRDVIPDTSTPAPQGKLPGLPAIPENAPEDWQGIRGGIFAGESGGDYNALFGFSNRTGGPFENVKLTEMTVDQALEFSDPSGPYAQWVNQRIGRVATPMGAYQIVGRTLRAAKSALELRGDELMTPDLQEQLGIWIYHAQGVGAWEGYSGPRASFVPGGIARWRNPGDDAQAAGIMSFDPRDLQTDANAYQYKMGGDQFGVTDRLQGERQWDATAAVGVIVHERMDGTRYIADGHQRLGLANRLIERGNPDVQLQGYLFREADGYSAEEVRALAALKNIRQESGTPLDAAKVMRDSPQLASQISRARPFMAQAQGLADLAPGPFQAVVNQVIPQNFGALVGRIIPDEDQIQGVAIAALAKLKPANETMAESVIRDIRRLGLEKQSDAAQMNLFGDGFDLRSTVISERAQIIDRVLKEARADRALFARLTTQAETIQEAGNVLNRSENAARLDTAEQILSQFLIAADQPGRIRDALDAAAKSVRAGGRIEAATAEVLDLLGRANDAPAAKSAADGAAGRGAADAALEADLQRPNVLEQPVETDTRLQPGLFDDPIEDVAETARLTGLERELTTALSDPQFDLSIPMGDANAPSLSLRALHQDLTEEADFVDAIKTLCLT